MRFKRWVTVSAVLGFVAFLVYIYLFTNVGNVTSILQRTNIAVYALAFLCAVGGAVFNALTWQRILGKLSVNTTFRRVFNLSWVGTFIDALVPGGWSGDIFKTYLLSKDKGADGAKAAASIIIKNVLELLVTLGALIVGIALLALNYRLENGLIIAIGVTMFMCALPLVIVIYMSTHLGMTKRMLGWIKRVAARIKGRPLDGSSSEGKLESSLKEFHDGIMTMKTNPKSMVEPIVLQSLAWAFDILALFIVFASIGSFVAPDKVIITNTIVVNLQSQGVALAGFTQIVSSTIYTVLGIVPMVAIASSLLAGFAGFWFKTIVSFFAFQMVVLNRCIPVVAQKCDTLAHTHKELELPILSKDLAEPT